MDFLKAPFLCFDPAHPEYIQLAVDYWSGRDVAGRWKWDASVEHLSATHGVARKDVPKFVKMAAMAVVFAPRCTLCNSPQELSSRSAFGALTYGNHVCSSCLYARNLALRQKHEADEKNRVAAKLAFIARMSQRKVAFRYKDILYIDAVFAFSIMLASDEACELGSFHQSEKLHLCASNFLTNKLLVKLCKAGVLQFHKDTQQSAIGIREDGELGYLPQHVKWRFALDAENYSYPAVMTLLGKIIDERELNPEYKSSVVELWRSIAYDDALDFLSREVSSYRLPDVRIGPKTEEAIWHALEHFSIPQVRRGITYVVKNAAALSQHRDFAKRHALNTIPGSLISYVDRAVSEGWQITPVLRNWQNEEPILTTVLFNRVLRTGLPGFRTLTNSTLQSGL